MRAWIIENSRPVDFGEDRLRERGSLPATFLDVYKRQMQQHSAEGFQEFEVSIDRMIRLAYPEEPEDFQMRFVIQTFTGDVRDSELQ